MTNATSAARTPAFPSKLPNVGTTIFTVMSALATEHNAVNLGQGFPDFECAPELVDAVTQAMKAGHNQYPPMPGVPALREAVARKIEALHGRAYNPGTEITIGIKHVRKADTLNNRVYLCLVRYTLCLLSSNSGKNGSVHPSEFLL